MCSKRDRKFNSSIPPVALAMTDIPSHNENSTVPDSQGSQRMLDLDKDEFEIDIKGFNGDGDSNNCKKQILNENSIDTMKANPSHPSNFGHDNNAFKTEINNHPAECNLNNTTSESLIPLGNTNFNVTSEISSVKLSSADEKDELRIDLDRQGKSFSTNESKARLTLVLTDTDLILITDSQNIQLNPFCDENGFQIDPFEYQENSNSDSFFTGDMQRNAEDNGDFSIFTDICNNPLSPDNHNGSLINICNCSEDYDRKNSITEQINLVKNDPCSTIRKIETENNDFDHMKNYDISNVNADPFDALAKHNYDKITDNQSNQLNSIDDCNLINIEDYWNQEHKESIIL